MIKFWWNDEPIVVGSFRWRVIDNDLKNTIKDVVKQFNANTKIYLLEQIRNELRKKK
jgi:hypothetical protein